MRVRFDKDHKIKAYSRPSHIYNLTYIKDVSSVTLVLIITCFLPWKTSSKYLNQGHEVTRGTFWWQILSSTLLLCYYFQKETDRFPRCSLTVRHLHWKLLHPSFSKQGPFNQASPSDALCCHPLALHLGEAA
jgi:hypothetical protein